MHEGGGYNFLFQDSSRRCESSLRVPVSRAITMQLVPLSNGYLFNSNTNLAKWVLSESKWDSCDIHGGLTCIIFLREYHLPAEKVRPGKDSDWPKRENQEI